MSFVTHSVASLALLPIFLSSLVGAMPAAEPMITAVARLAERANGANVIGFSTSGTGWRTRSCNNGFFSTSGTLGNCCANSNCDFITTCLGSSVYYAAGTKANCGNVCGTGTILHTVGDLRPVYMFNCDADWTVTMSPSVSTTRTSTTRTSTTRTSTTSTTTVVHVSTYTPDPTTVISTRAGVVATTAAETSISTYINIAAASSIASAGRPVTLTVTDSSGVTSTQVLAASATASNPPLSTHNKTTTSKTGLIAGVAVGAVVALALLAIAIFFFLRHKSKKTKAAAAISTQPEYMAPVVGNNHEPQGSPPRFSQVAPIGAYQPPMHPMYPNAHEVAGSPVSPPVEMPAHSR
ncbi:hypothetical protein EJ08DRAFT_269769 [Tothia fuscella]|uniref:Mid2 domain-containing protein n=1 Tax=Tothia fuscella TaxID=1048955 RepID=A0A9P4TXG4_9PEZI|nr:hypothetical protein EJ08DRAFT_269769 [Tothia fuscella]